MIEGKNNEDNYEVPMADEIDYSGTNPEDYQVVDKEYQQERIGKKIEQTKAKLDEVEKSLQQLLNEKEVLKTALKEDEAELNKWNF